MNPYETAEYFSKLNSVAGETPFNGRHSPASLERSVKEKALEDQDIQTAQHIIGLGGSSAPYLGAM